MPTNRTAATTARSSKRRARDRRRVASARVSVAIPAIPIPDDPPSQHARPTSPTRFYYRDAALGTRSPIDPSHPSTRLVGLLRGRYHGPHGSPARGAGAVDAAISPH